MIVGKGVEKTKELYFFYLILFALFILACIISGQLTLLLLCCFVL